MKFILNFNGEKEIKIEMYREKNRRYRFATNIMRAEEQMI